MQIQDLACHAANRVDVAAGFVTGSSARASSSACVLDAFRVTEDLLCEVSQTGQLDEFIRYVATTNGSFVDRSSTDKWVKFLLGQIKLWHTAKLNQKTIETVGDLLSVWTPKQVDAEELSNAVRTLQYVTVLAAEEHADKWAQEEPELSHRMQALALTLSGIAVIAANNSVNRTPDDREAYTGISYGASLVVDCVERFLA